MDQAIHSKKLASVWTDRAIRSKNIVSRLNSLSYPFKSAVWTARATKYPIKKNWQPLEWFKLSRSKKFVNRSSYLLEKTKQ